MIIKTLICLLIVQRHVKVIYTYFSALIVELLSLLFHSDSLLFHMIIFACHEIDKCYYTWNKTWKRGFSFQATFSLTSVRVWLLWLTDCYLNFIISVSTPINPKLANTAPFPVYLELDYVPSLQFLEPVHLIIPLGVDALAFIGVSHVSWVLKSRLGTEAAVEKHSSEALLTSLFYDGS